MLSEKWRKIFDSTLENREAKLFLQGYGFIFWFRHLIISEVYQKCVTTCSSDIKSGRIWRFQATNEYSKWVQKVFSLGFKPWLSSANPWRKLLAIWFNQIKQSGVIIHEWLDSTCSLFISVFCWVDWTLNLNIDTGSLYQKKVNVQNLQNLGSSENWSLWREDVGSI